MFSTSSEGVEKKESTNLNASQDNPSEKFLGDAVTEKLSQLEINDILKDQVDNAENSNVRNDIAKQIAEEFLGSIIQEVTSQDNSDTVSQFIRDTLHAISDNVFTVEMSKNDIYFWMTYFYLQFCGYQFFMKCITSEIKQTASVDEISMIIIDLVDEVAENSQYLKPDSDIPEFFAKNLIWKILNCSKLQRRYAGLSTAENIAADIVEDLVNHIRLPDQYTDLSVPSILHVPKKKKKLFHEPGNECYYFSGIENIAEHVVDYVINLSCNLRTQVSSTTLMRIHEEIENKLEKAAAIHPPLASIREFTVVLGEKIIENYINDWVMKENWLHCIDFLMAQSDGCSDYYFYDLKWSLPTQIYPVAQATASVYFRFEISRVKPKSCPIDFQYQFEGNSLIHKPYMYPFKENWLFNILDAKILVFKQIKF